jgi:hypothetical protein
MLALTHRNRYALALLSGLATFGERLLTEYDLRRFDLPQGVHELQVEQTQPPGYGESGVTTLCAFDFNIFWLANMYCRYIKPS